MRRTLRAFGCLLVSLAAASLPGQENGQTLQALVSQDEAWLVERIVQEGPRQSLRIQALKTGGLRIEPCEKSFGHDDALSGNGRFLAYSKDTEAVETELCILDLKTMRISRRKSELGLEFLFLPSGEELIADDSGGIVRLSADGLKVLARYEEPGYEFSEFFALPDGRHLATVSRKLADDGDWELTALPQLRLFRLPELRPVGEPTPVKSSVASMGATPEGHLLVLLGSEDLDRVRPNQFRRTDFVFEIRAVPDLKVIDSFSFHPGQRHRSYMGTQRLTFVDDNRYVLWPHHCPLLLDWKGRTPVGLQPAIPPESLFLPRSRLLLAFERTSGRLHPPLAIDDWAALFRAAPQGSTSGLLPPPSDDLTRQRDEERAARQQAVDRFHKVARIDGDPAEWVDLAGAAENWADPIADWIPPTLQPVSGQYAVDKGDLTMRLDSEFLRPFYLKELTVLPGAEGFSILVRPAAAPDAKRPNSYYLSLDLPYGDSEDLQIQLSGSGRHRFFVNDRGTLRFPDPVPIEVAFGETIEVYLPYASIRALLPEIDAIPRPSPAAPLDCEITAFSMFRLPKIRTALSAIRIPPRMPASDSRPSDAVNRDAR